MWKQHRVVMLATNQTKIGTIMQCIKVPSSENYEISTLVINKNHHVVTTNGNDYWQPRELYILSDDEIEKGDWCIMLDSFGNIFSNPQQYTDPKTQHLNKGLKKIIATTDSSLKYTDYRISPVPNFCDYLQIPQSFIQYYIDQFNSGNTITDVMVEYEGIEWLDRPLEYFIKVYNDNTISIKTIKDS
jgi:hypothetical protein